MLSQDPSPLEEDLYGDPETAQAPNPDLGSSILQPTDPPSSPQPEVHLEDPPATPGATTLQEPLPGHSASAIQDDHSPVPAQPSTGSTGTEVQVQQPRPSRAQRKAKEASYRDSRRKQQYEDRQASIQARNDRIHKETMIKLDHERLALQLKRDEIQLAQDRLKTLRDMTRHGIQEGQSIDLNRLM